MSSSLLGEAAPAEVIRTIETQIAAGPEVSSVIHMMTQHLGPEDLLVAAKVEFSTDLSMRELAQAINSCEQRVRSAVPSARLIYLEPDLLGPGGDGAR
jgi:divalent metal cation (Fe/Co/Zn/Cd) transporter